MKWRKRSGKSLFLAMAVLFLTCSGRIMTPARAAETEKTTQETEAETEIKETETKEKEILSNVKKAPEFSGKWVRKGKKYRFRKQDGTFAADTWLKVKGRYYYVDAQGVRVQGFLKYGNGNRYYLGKDGAMVFGWQKIQKKMYYFDKRGAMKRSSWVKTKGKYYYVNGKGRRLTSHWVTVDGKKYYVDENGVKVTSSRYIKGKACYFDKKGVYHPKKKVKERLVDPKKKMVALTFDDGPGPYTDRLLNCLKKNKAAATFFLVGSSIPNYKSAVKKMKDIGCEIGSHTWDHAQLTQLSAAGIQSQINRTNQEIRAITGKNAALLRPPYGAYNGTVSSYAGMPLIMWSIDTLDWKTRNTANTVNVVMQEVKDGSIVLMHDIHSPSVDAAEILIPRLMKAGYQLVTVSELAKYRGTEMRSGGTYFSF